MRIFGGHHRTVAAFPTNLVEPCCTGILGHVHVGVVIPQRALVVDRSIHQSAVLILHELVGIEEIDAVTRFVTQRPEGDRGVVLVPFEHVDRPLHVCLLPFGVPGE